MWNAVATSPHGMVTAVRGPRPKSITRVLYPGGTGVSAPSRRTTPPRWRFSTIVVAVPRDERRRDLEPEREMGRGGQARLQVRGQAIRGHDVEADARAAA